MTAIAWAIVLAALTIYDMRINKKNKEEDSEDVGMFCFVALILCTIREWVR